MIMFAHARTHLLSILAIDRSASADDGLSGGGALLGDGGAAMSDTGLANPGRCKLEVCDGGDMQRGSRLQTAVSLGGGSDIIEERSLEKVRPDPLVLVASGDVPISNISKVVELRCAVAVLSL